MADEKKSIGPEAEKPAEAPAQRQADPVKAMPPEQASPPTPGKVVDFAAAREEAVKDKATAQKAAPQKAPADKSDGADKPRGGRPAKAGKAAPGEAAAPKRDKKSQNKTAAEKAPAKDKAAPAQPEQPPEPRDASRGEKEEVVYLNLSELHPFKNHPFGIRDDAEMQGLVESVKASGVNQPALVRPREDGGDEIIAGHRRLRASELAGFMNMPRIVRSMTDDEAVLANIDFEQFSLGIDAAARHWATLPPSPIRPMGLRLPKIG